MWGNRKAVRQSEANTTEMRVPGSNSPDPTHQFPAAEVQSSFPAPVPGPSGSQAPAPASSAFPPAVTPGQVAPGAALSNPRPDSPFPQTPQPGPGAGAVTGTPLSANNAATSLGSNRSGSSNDPVSGRNRWLPLVLALAFLVTAIGAFLLGRLSSSSESATGLVPTRTQQAPANDPSTPTTAAGPIDAGSSDEPVVAVAQAVAPTVVQLVVPQPGGGTSLGSGFFYDDQGRILTNAHVVGDAEAVLVRLASGTQIEGTVIGADDVSDVAVVQVSETEGTPPAVLATGVPVQVGQLAVVLGSPFGLEQTVTSGIVSAINRPLSVDPNSNTPPQAMIQTDASINQGNSGGPLVDRQGRVIGINSAIFSRSGTADGVGFAIPIDRATDIAALLVSGEDIDRGLLGVGGRNPVTGRAGALITEVSPGSGADAGGIEVGDLITMVDEREIRSISDLGAVIRARLAGDEVLLQLVRDGVELETAVTLGSE